VGEKKREMCWSACAGRKPTIEKRGKKIVEPQKKKGRGASEKLHARRPSKEKGGEGRRAQITLITVWGSCPVRLTS